MAKKEKEVKENPVTTISEPYIDEDGTLKIKVTTIEH